MGEAASWWSRVFAEIIDGILLSVPLYVLFALFWSGTTTVTTSPNGQIELTQGGRSLAVWYLVAIVVTLVYFGLLDGGRRGQTVGKMVLRISVKDGTTGHPIGFWRAVIRRIIYGALWAVFFVPGLLNALSPLWDPRRKAWHDHAVDSLVVDAP